MSIIQANQLSVQIANVAGGITVGADANVAGQLGVTGNIWVNGANIDTRGRHTIFIHGTGITPAFSNGAFHNTFETTTNKQTVRTLDFDPIVQKFGQFSIQMPKSWDRGNVFCQVVWSHANTVTNYGVVWSMQAVAYGNDNVLDTAFGTEQNMIDTGGTNNAIYISPESPGIVVEGSPAAEEYITFQIKRSPANTNDTLSIDARLHGVKIHYVSANTTED